MITKPSVFLLDEPTSGLDSVASNQVDCHNIRMIILQEHYLIYTHTLIKKISYLFLHLSYDNIKIAGGGDTSTAH